MQFIPFKDEAAWDNWSRSTIAQARAQDVHDVLDPSYTPITVEETELFEEKLKYMYAVFEKTLLTDKGKALVRAHQKTYNAQLIYKELQEYARVSTKATMEASSCCHISPCPTLVMANKKVPLMLTSSIGKIMSVNIET
jgi:hypothetical protein